MATAGGFRPHSGNICFSVCAGEHSYHAASRVFKNFTAACVVWCISFNKGGGTMLVVLMICCLLKKTYLG